MASKLAGPQTTDRRPQTVVFEKVFTWSIEESRIET
jgi:hypothetical protein